MFANQNTYTAASPNANGPATSCARTRRGSQHPQHGAVAPRYVGVRTPRGDRHQRMAAAMRSTYARVSAYRGTPWAARRVRARRYTPRARMNVSFIATQQVVKVVGSAVDVRSDRTGWRRRTAARSGHQLHQSLRAGAGDRGSDRRATPHRSRRQRAWGPRSSPRRRSARSRRAWPSPASGARRARSRRRCSRRGRRTRGRRKAKGRARTRYSIFRPKPVAGLVRAYHDARPERNLDVSPESRTS